MRDGHGDDLHHYADIRANFSSNVTQLVDPSPLRQHLAKSIDRIGSYPEPTGKDLAELLASYHGVSSSCYLICNGATEAIYLVAQAWREHKHYFSPDPTFSEYQDAVRLYQAEYEELEELIPPSLEKGSIYWLCSPNNPTGRSYPLEELHTLWRSHPEVTFVLDNSYAHFSEAEQPDMAFTIHSFPNVLFITSLTKRYAMPGLRLGYLMGQAHLIERLLPYRQPWSVGSLALEAGKWLAQEHFPNLLDKALLFSEAKRLKQAIAKLPFFEVESSDTHFFLVHCSHPRIKTGEELKELLAQRYHLLVRDATNFGYTEQATIRLATQAPWANNLLLEALQEIASLPLTPVS